MGLRGNKGLKYFPLVTDFFQDRDVRRLMLSCGEAGVLLYIYILCATYAKSYCLKWDEDMLMDASMDLRCEAERLEEALNYMLEKGFFDRELFQQRGLLSSKAVQRQFQECARVMRKKRVVDRELWLLSQEETNTAISFSDDKTAQACAKTDVNCAETDADCAKEGANCAISAQRKGKEKKLKESKGERERSATAPVGPRNDRPGETDCHASLAMTAPAVLAPHPAALPPPSPQGGKALEGERIATAAEPRQLSQRESQALTLYREKIDLGGRGEEELRGYAETLGQELCLFALERALEQDKPHWSYVRAILRSYKQQGYTSVAQAKEEQQRHRQSYGRDNYGFRGRNVQASCQGYEPADMEKLKKMYDLI